MNVPPFELRSIPAVTGGHGRMVESVPSLVVGSKVPVVRVPNSTITVVPRKCILTAPAKTSSQQQSSGSSSGKPNSAPGTFKIPCYYINNSRPASAVPRRKVGLGVLPFPKEERNQPASSAAGVVSILKKRVNDSKTVPTIPTSCSSGSLRPNPTPRMPVVAAVASLTPIQGSSLVTTRVAASPKQNGVKRPQSTPFAAKPKANKTAKPSIVTLSSDEEDEPPKSSESTSNIPNAIDGRDSVSIIEGRPSYSLPDSTNFPLLTELSLDPNEPHSRLMPVLMPVKDVRVNGTGLKVEENAGRMQFDADGISFPVRALDRSSVQIFQAPYSDLYACKYVISDNLIAFLFICRSICVDKFFENHSNVLECINLRGGTHLKFLVVCNSRIEAETKQRLRIQFELLNFRRQTVEFFKEDIGSIADAFSSDAKPVATVPPMRNGGTPVRVSEKKVLFTYKTKLRGTISITADDAKTLMEGEYLNDTIIDFYCSYLVDTLLDDQTRDRVHLFNSFFYNNYSQVKPMKKCGDNMKTRRHNKVKSWTRNVDLFTKDFIIVPINEDMHWFLVVVAYPAAASRHKEAPPEGLASSEGSSQKKNLQDLLRKKYPCVIIFNSLPMPGHDVVFRHIKDYLEIEHENKIGFSKLWDRRLVCNASPQLPYQPNSYDCGLFTLKYLEMFIRDFILDDSKSVQFDKWFAARDASKMRGQLLDLIHDLERTGGNPITT